MPLVKNLIFIDIPQQVAYIPQKERDSPSYNSFCSPIHSEYGLENDQHILRSISELDGNTFWIGENVYHVTFPWVEILGRYLDADLSMF